MTVITGTLKNARFNNTTGVDVRLIGDVYGDTRRRFQDGERIHTGRVIKKHPGNIYQTLFSTYKVEFASEAI